jgi:tRNA A58 N-methylase Trm61
MSMLTIFVLLGTAVFAALFGVLFIILEMYVGIIGYYKGAPFVRSKKDRIRTMIELARIRPGMRAVDLGSGDGSIVIEAAKQGSIAVGVEFNPFLVWYARFRARRAGVADRVTIIKGDLFVYPLDNADVLFLYLLPRTLVSLAPKLKTELKPKARIISNAFAFPDWKPIEERNDVRVYSL